MKKAYFVYLCLLGDGNNQKEATEDAFSRLTMLNSLELETMVVKVVKIDDLDSGKVKVKL